MKNKIIEDLRELSQIVGIASRESRVVKAIKQKVEGLADEIKVDIGGNLIATLKGTEKDAPTLMLDAHTDEIGLIVRHISADGFIYFAKIGGFIDLIFPSQTVILVPDDETKKPVYGVIGIKPPHITVQGEAAKIPTASELAIDIGASSLEEVNSLGIDIGTTGTLVGEFRELGSGKVLGKAFDDRTGCVVLIEIIRRLTKNRPKGTIIFNFASGEEVGARGATTAAYTINPDIALAIENTTAGDTPGVSSQDCPTKLSDGPAITIADASLIVNEKIINKLKSLADELKIPWQYKRPLSGGTDAGRIALVRGGIPSGVVSVPCRYIHSPVSILDPKDIERTCDLVEAFARSFTEIL
ncbi:MAG: M42 family metallopeptidase [Candidatus Heimdallarchaeota archaeon]|nr:M42 family metallopeptidase [Candidatus Heimdallarchaeota archaeon]